MLQSGRYYIVTEISQNWSERGPTDSFFYHLYSDQPIDCPRNQASRAITKAVSFPAKRGEASCNYELKKRLQETSIVVFTSVSVLAEQSFWVYFRMGLDVEKLSKNSYMIPFICT